MTTARWFVGGPFDGEIRVVDETSMSISVPILDRFGNTLTPPRWSVYAIKGEEMAYVGDAASVGDAIEAIIQARAK